MEEYQHPPTFQSTGDVGADFLHSTEDYEVNVAPHLPPSLSSRILDVGCGWGQFLWWVRSLGYEQLEGIDLGSDQVKHCSEMGLSATRVNDSAEFLKSHPAQFDLVTIHHVIEHMANEKGVELLRAARASLRPGGQVIVQTPNMSAVSAAYSRHIEITHVTGYTDSSLVQALGMAGFQKVKVWGNKTPFRRTPRRLLWIGLQAGSRLLWRAMLFAELGSDTPGILTKNIYASGEKE